MASYQLQFSDTFLSEIFMMPKKVQQAYEKEGCPILRNAPETAKGNRVKKLHGDKQLWRLRLADDYRLVYRVDQKARCVQMLMIGNRATIYRRLGRHADPEDLTAAVPDAEVTVGQAAPAYPGVSVQPGGGAVANAPRPDNPLPMRLTSHVLTEWGVPEEFQRHLMAATTEGALLETSPPVSQEVLERILSILYPSSIDEAKQQPVRLLPSQHSFLEIRNGERSLESFLLRLDPEQEEVVERFSRSKSGGPWLLKGGPGSGKSTVLLYCIRALLERAMGELDLGPRGLRILLTTYTNSLSRASEQLMRDLGCLDGRHQIEVATVTQLATRVNTPPTRGMKAIGEWRDTVEKALVDLQKASPRFPFKPSHAGYIRDEIERIIHGQGCRTMEDYLKADRTGRARAIGEAQRKAIWEVHEATEATLRQNKQVPWSALRLEAQEYAKPKYDYVFVDEVQDLDPTSIRLCLAHCHDPRNVFLAADANQSIYGNGIAWATVADTLKFRGRTRLLKRNYRSTHQIWEAAKAAAPPAATVRDADTMAIQAVRDGTRPVLVKYRSMAELRGWTEKYLHEVLIRERLAPGAAAILCPTNKEVARMATFLPERFQPREMDSQSVDLGHPGVKVMTMHAAKGLQFPVVFVAGLRKGLLPHSRPDGADPVEHAEQQQRLLFVALSRAMRRLVVFADVKQPSPFLGLLPDRVWDVVDL